MLNLTGKRFGRWTAMKCLGSKNKQRIWLCRCDCGNRKQLPAKVLNAGMSKSCGCLNLDSIIERSTKHGHHRRGQTTKEYRAWCNMKQRCLNPNNTRYSRYGSIIICEEWKNDFQKFLADMGPCPPKWSLERRDNEGPYSVQNCVWASDATQRRNQRRTHLLKINSEIKCVNDWAKISGTDHRTILARLKKGWNAQYAVFGKN